MGRKSLHRTYEEILEIKRINALKYYNIHKDKINFKKRKEYTQLKQASKKYEN